MGWYNGWKNAEITTKTAEKELTVELLQAILGTIKIKIMGKLDKMEMKFET